MALALQTVLDDLGRGLGPFVIGLLVQVTSRLVAFNVAILGWIPCGALIYGTLVGIAYACWTCHCIHSSCAVVHCA